MRLGAGQVFGGWKMTGITTFQTGFPFNVTTSSFSSLTCDAFSFYGCPDAPNQLKPVSTSLDPRTSTFTNPLAGKSQGNYWFDPTAFARVPTCAYDPITHALTNGNVCGTFGNVSRSVMHGPGINNFDFSLQKDTKLGERVNMQLGIEAFNLFNHTQFNNPSGNINSTNFGRITSAGPGRIAQLRAKFSF